jgi:hypothetical protein
MPPYDAATIPHDGEALESLLLIMPESRRSFICLSYAAFWPILKAA